MFTPVAVELGKRGRIELVDRKQLTQWLSKLKLENKPGETTPRKYQADALAELARQRGARESKFLIIMAAGLGKTLTAAFDIAQFETGLGRPARVMFLAHQAVILEQASRAFRKVFGPSRSFGR